MKKSSNVVAAISTFLLVSTAWGLSNSKTPPSHRISEKKAEGIALHQAKGAIESHELEFENGRWVYSFDIRGNDKAIHEVQVDAQSGALVSNKMETPAQEAQEAAAEPKTK